MVIYDYMASNRTKTGILGLDNLIEGGLPKNSITLVSGSPGTGKSILCLQYILNGATIKEPGIYVTFEQSEKDIIDNAKKVGLDLKPHIKSGIIKVIFINLGTFERGMVDADALISHINEEAKGMKAKRLVIDSISSVINIFMLSNICGKAESDVIEIGKTKVIPLVIDENPVVRDILWTTFRGLKKTGCTCIATSELIKGQSGYSRDNISEFLCEGIIVLHSVEGEEAFRTLHIPKMRQTNQMSGIYSFEITNKGIIVKSKEG